MAVLERPLILDDELADHLGNPESILYLYRERFSKDLLLADEHYVAKVWDFVSSYIEEFHEPPDLAVMTEEFPQFEFQAPAHPIEYVLRKFRERYAKNGIKISIKKVSRALDDPLEAGALAYREFQDIALKTQERSTRLDNLDWPQFLEAYKKEVLEGRFQGTTFGWEEIDDILGGLRKGSLYYIIGRPKRFKSWCLLKSAIEAQKQGQKVLFYSLELPQKEMFGRMVCLTSNVSWERFQHGQLLSQDYKVLHEAEERLREYPTFTIDRPEAGKRTVPDLIKTAKELEATVVYVDQMSFIENHRAPAHAPLWEQIKYQCHDLKNQAVSADIPICVAAQFNRLADNPTLAEMGDLSMIAGGDAIGQYADMVLGLYQSKALRESHLLEYGTIESRSFEHARWHLKVRLTEACAFSMVEKITE